MATHSSVLAWRIPGMGSVVGCRLWGHTELDMTEATWQQQEQIIKFLRVPKWRHMSIQNQNLETSQISINR